MNAKLSKLIREYSKISGLSYKKCKHTFNSGDKDLQQRFLTDIKQVILRSKTKPDQVVA